MNYIINTLKHKWFVFLACLRVGGIPIGRILWHDMSKFNPAEFRHYHRFHSGDKSDPAGFAIALLHHWNSNPHHYQYWTDRPDHSSHYRNMFQQCNIIHDGIFEMPKSYAREMVADWMGATRMHTGSWNMAGWLNENLPNMKLHPRTRRYVVYILQEMGYAIL